MTDRETVDKHFRYDYCITCHSAQGATIKITLTIHEWELSHLVSREWIWTRADDFRKVMFFKNDKFDRVMDKNRIMNYLDNKIEGYKQQDRKAGRKTNDENYIDAKWCLKRMRGNCQKCGKGFELETKKGKLCSNFTEKG